MKISLAIAFGNSARRDMGFAKEFASAAEEAGFAKLYFPEHVVFFPKYASKYPYTADGAPNWGPETGIYDPLFTAAVCAQVTTTLGFASSVLILPERPALLVAKEVMTLDHACGGRFDLGIGIGWSDEEYAALGMAWDHRGKRCDEWVGAMRAAWTQDRASYHGEYVNFDDVVLAPKPVNGTVKIIVGGDSPAAMRRAARLGDGWYGWWASGELEPHLDSFRAVMADHNRAFDDSFSLRIGTPLITSPEDATARSARAQAAGVDEFVIGPYIPGTDFAGHLRRWLEACSGDLS